MNSIVDLKIDELNSEDELADPWIKIRSRSIFFETDNIRNQRTKFNNNNNNNNNNLVW